MAFKKGGPGVDILFGTGDDDIMHGLDSNDVLWGLGGNDILKGGGGADSMLGGEGNDVYTVDDAGDKVIESADAGIDTVHSAVDFVLPDHVEKLFLTASAVHGTGNNDMNHIVGNGEDNVIKGLGGSDWLNGGDGDDVIFGGDGHDEIDGGLGADDMWGGADTDDFIVDNLGDVVHGGSGIDQVWSSVDFLLPDDTEQLILGGSAAFGAGNSADNLIWGNANSNMLFGNDGNDEIDGHNGSDTLFGGLGRDTLTGGVGLDFFVWYYTAETGLTEGTADIITDFNFAEVDRISVAEIDADVFADDSQAFTFIGMAAFSGTPGEINYYHSGGNTYIQLQTGNAVDVEAVICLEGIHDPEASWFIL